MNYWHFKFEGVFLGGSENEGEGVFSSCLVPESNRSKAKAVFLDALHHEKIRLIDLLDSFPVNGEELDPDDPVNRFWIDWYCRTKRKASYDFDTFHIYSIEKGTK